MSMIHEVDESPYPDHFAVSLLVQFNPDTVDLDDEASLALLQHFRDTVHLLEEELAEWLDLTPDNAYVNE